MDYLKEAKEMVEDWPDGKMYVLVAIAEELKQLNFILDLILQQLQGGIVTYKRD